MVKIYFFLFYEFDKKGVLRDFILFISDVWVSIGVGFIYFLVGMMSIMLGLFIWFCFYDIDFDIGIE